MTNEELTFNQINAVISYLPEEERNLLPKTFVNFFKNKSTASPENSIDISLPLEKQNFTDEAMLILYHITKLLKH